MNSPAAATPDWRCSMAKTRGRYKVTRTTDERFWEKVDKFGPVPEFAPQLGRCWIWVGAAQRYGYGSFAIHSDVTEGGWKRVLAHRFSYERLVGPVEKGLDLDHLCRIPACVNPEHLQPVTHRENNLRGMSGALKTHCVHGHEYTTENTAYVTEKRYRRCRECERQRRASRSS